MRTVRLLIPIALIIAAIGLWYWKSQQITKPGKQPPITRRFPTKRTVTVYFGDAQSGLLVPARREINSVEPAEAASILELMNGVQKGERGESLIPPETKLLQHYTRGDTLYLSFNEVFRQGLKSEPWANLAIYSIVNTVTGLKETGAEPIRKVVFLINGEKVDSIGGVDTTEPLARDENLIIKDEKRD